MIPGRSTFRSISLSAKVFKLPRFLHPRDAWRKFSRMSSTTRPGQSDSIVPFLGLESPKNNEKKQHPKQPQPRNASVNARDTGSIPKGTFPKNFFFCCTRCKTRLLSEKERFSHLHFLHNCTADALFGKGLFVASESTDAMQRKEQKKSSAQRRGRQWSPQPGLPTSSAKANGFFGSTP